MDVETKLIYRSQAYFQLEYWSSFSFFQSPGISSNYKRRKYQVNDDSVSFCDMFGTTLVICILWLLFCDDDFSLDYYAYHGSQKDRNNHKVVQHHHHFLPVSFLPSFMLNALESCKHARGHKVFLNIFSPLTLSSGLEKVKTFIFGWFEKNTNSHWKSWIFFLAYLIHICGTFTKFFVFEMSM